MTTPEIAHLRLSNQALLNAATSTPQALVSKMGAIQAQDYPMAKWAIGTRLADANEAKIDKAIHTGTIIRTHILRPTWHFVAARDIAWMLELTAPHVKTIVSSGNKGVGLTADILKKSNKIIAQALKGNIHLTRDKLKTLLETAKIPCNDNRASHIFAWAELEGVICSGRPEGSKQTYALLEERVKATKTLSRSDALAKLAERYFTAHGPASLKDFIWWSGLSVVDAKNALEQNKKKLTEIATKEDIYWTKNTEASVASTNDSSLLLPSFDEYLIGYKNRTAAIPLDLQSRAFTNNGIFRPIIVVNGQVKGIWSRVVVKDKVDIITNFFETPNKAITKAVSIAAEKYASYLGKELGMMK